MTADQIHQLGLDEVARISAEMEKVKAQVGYEGDLVSFFDYVRNNKELMPFTKPEQVIEYFDGIHETMKPHLEKLFNNKPKTPFEVRRAYSIDSSEFLKKCVSEFVNRFDAAVICKESAFNPAVNIL